MGTDGKIRYGWWNGSSAANLVSANTLNDGQWHHVVGTHGSDPAGGSLYIDGVLEDTDSSVLYPYATMYWRIGSYNIHSSYFTNGSDGYFDGLIDNVRIYNYVLNQKQILEDMNGGGPAIKQPVLHLAFDEGYGDTAYDKSIFKNNGTLVHGGSGTNDSYAEMWDLGGKSGKAIEFDGTNDYAAIPSTNLLGSNLSSFSVSAWIKKKSNNTVDGLVWHNTDSQNSSYRISTYSDGGVNYQAGRWDTGFEIEGTIISDTTNWHHLAMTFDGTTLRGYFDGKEDGESSSGIYTAGNAATWIGVGNFGTDNYWGNSYIDEVKVWNYALSEDEVKTLYNSGASAVMGDDASRDNNGTAVTGASKEYCVPGDTSPCDPPVGEWNFDEKTGTTTYDTSGNGNDWFFYSAATSPTWDRGRKGSALRFDGAASLTYIPSYSLPANFTFSAWVNPHNLDNNQSILTVQNRTFYIDSLGDYGYWNNGSAGSGSFGPALLNQWQYIVYTYDGTNLRAYLNASRSGSDLSSTISTSGYVSFFGVYDESYYFSGLIDDVKIYDYARTPAQIAWDYNRGQPIAHWAFNECSGGTIHDESGNGNNGQLYLGTSGVTATGTCASSSASFWYNGKDGKRNSAGSFDGQDDFVSVPHSSELMFTEGSYSAWVKVDTSDNSDQLILAKGDGAGNNGYVLAVNENDSGNSPKTLTCQVRESGSTGTAYAKTQFTEGIWYHVACIFNSSEDLKLYINGEYQDMNNHAMGSNTGNLVMGDFAGTYPFDGEVDEVKIFNYALTAEQIRTEFNGGAVRFGN